MTDITSRYIEVSGITVEVVRKRIKNLHILCIPPVAGYGWLLLSE